MLERIDLPLSKDSQLEFDQNIAMVQARYQQLDETSKSKRARDLAVLPGLTEAQWVAAQTGNERSIALSGKPHEILGHVSRPDIDLRMFFSMWSHVWAGEEKGRCSLQFFAKAGVAIHKIFCTDQTNMAEYLALVGESVSHDAVESMFNAVANRHIPIMCFVGNRGMIQIHSERIEPIQRTGSWLNILDARFNLHLDTTKSASIWIVNKPSRDGWITSMELYAGSGELIVQFFGASKPGLPELTGWRDLMVSMCSESLAA